MRRMGVIILCVAIGAAVTGACKAAKRTIAGAKAFGVSAQVIESDSVCSVEFGKIKEGEVVTRKLRLKNIASEPFLVEQIKAGCSCLSFEFSREPIKEGETTTVGVIFDSQGFGGEIIRDVDIYTSLHRKPLSVKVMATIK